MLVLPVGPGTGLREVALEGFAYAGPLDIAEHFYKVKVSHHHRFQGAICCEGLQGGPPMSQRLTWQVDTPLMHIQGGRPETFLHKANQALGVRRPQEFAYFDGSGRGRSFCAASRGVCE